MAINLSIPQELQPSPERCLPEITPETLQSLETAGWSRLGIMVALVDDSGDVLMLRHNKRRKNHQDELGPLGETSQHQGPVIEQPLMTLFRGIKEEIGLEQPAEHDWRVRGLGAWAINAWPVGRAYPGEYACAVSFPVFVNDEIKQTILNIAGSNEEISGVHGFVAPSDILAMDESRLRLGVKPWLRQLLDHGLLEPTDHLVRADFSPIFEAGMTDVRFKA